jgi:hypothetical protein
MQTSCPWYQLTFLGVLQMRIDKVQIWVDAEMTFESALPREVTDCEGNILELGDYNIPSLGEMIFAANALNQQQLREIMFAGFTLQDIAVGKQPFTSKAQLSDTILTRTDEQFATAAGERAGAAVKLMVESSITRHQIEFTANPPEVTVDPMINVTKKASCKEIPCFGKDTSCRIIDDWTDAVEHDGVANKSFYNLVPPDVRPTGAGARDRIRIDHTTPNEYLRYDSISWPSFCNQSATFSMWIETDTVNGVALLSRYQVPDSQNISDLQWALFAHGYGLQVKGLKGITGVELSHVLPASFLKASPKEPLEKMKYGMQRHVTFVFDAANDETKTYLDGSLLGTTTHAFGTLANLDCNLNQETAYTGLGHLAPGTKGVKGLVQDWRYYRGHVLSKDEIYKIAVDTSGPARRSCKHDDEGSDSAWTDVYGHDCSWYYLQKKKSSGVCATEEVQRQCPVACGKLLPCFERHLFPSHFYLYDRIVKFEDARQIQGAGLICPRKGVDLVARCRSNLKNPDRSPAPGASGSLIPADGSPYRDSYMDINITDCDRLEYVLDPYCAFTPLKVDAVEKRRRAGTTFNDESTDESLPVVGGRRGDHAGSVLARPVSSEKEWARETHKEIMDTGGYGAGWTIEFWVKIDSRTRIPETNEVLVVCVLLLLPFFLL